MNSYDWTAIFYCKDKNIYAIKLRNKNQDNQWIQITRHTAHRMSVRIEPAIFTVPITRGGNLRVILVRVCGQVFCNLPQSCTWSSKKNDLFIYLIEQNVNMFIYCSLIFYIPSRLYYNLSFWAEYLSKNISIFKQGCQKMCPFKKQWWQTGSVIYFFLEKGAYRIPGSAKKGAIRAAHPCYVILPATNGNRKHCFRVRWLLCEFAVTAIRSKAGVLLLIVHCLSMLQLCEGICLWFFICQVPGRGK